MDPELLRWRGKVALVTGASSGIGATIATSLGELGMKVAIAGRDQARLRRVALEVERAGGEALVLRGDQARAPVNARFFGRIRRKWGGIDVLVNSAGVRGGRSLLQGDWAELQSALDLNVRAALLCMRQAVDDMRNRKDAAIINISSMTGHRVLPGVPALYAATKHALRVLTDGLRTELVEQNLPIKVALISPGLVDTPWHRPPGPGTKKRPFPYPPLQPADIANAVRYILSAPRHVQVCDILIRPSEQPN